MEVGFTVYATTGTPRGLGVSIAYARSSHITDGWVAKRAYHLLEIVWRGDVVAVKLSYYIIFVIAPSIIEVRHVAFFALRSSWPLRPVVFSVIASRRDFHAVLRAPGKGFDGRCLVAQPDVVSEGISLPQHGREGQLRNLPGLRRSFS